MGDSLKTSEELDASAFTGAEYARITQSGANRRGTMSQWAPYLRGLVNAFTKNQSVTFSALTSGTTVSVDASLSNNFYLSLAHNATIANPTNLTDGMVLNFYIANTGAFTCAFGTKFKFPGGAPTVTSGAGKIDLVSGVYHAAGPRAGYTALFGRPAEFGRLCRTV